ncbi:3-oxoacyl-[acyl-carrier-protein] synthase I, chloroplastic [Linum perenne]
MASTAFGSCSSSGLRSQISTRDVGAASPVSVSPAFLSSSAKRWRRSAVRAMAVSAPEREKDPKKRVVITGMGLVSVFGNDVDTFYNKLLEGESGITLIDRFDASSFSVRFAGQIRDFSSTGYIDGKNDRRLDDCWRYCLVAGKRALEDASLGPQALENVSVK